MKFIFDELKLSNNAVDKDLSDEEIECTINVNIDKLPLEVKNNYVKYSHSCREGAKVYLELFEKDVISYVKEAFTIDAGITKIKITLSKETDGVEYPNTDDRKDQSKDITQTATNDIVEGVEDEVQDDVDGEKDGGNE